MNTRELLRTVIEVFFLLAAIVGVGLFLRSSIGEKFFLEDAANFGWVFGVVGAIYTLVAAFVIFGVWSQFNELSNLITKESRLLVALWDLVDYFNDQELDATAKRSLLGYIDGVVEDEVGLMAQNQRINTYSEKFIAIRQAIDQIRFDDARDCAVFSLVAGLYRDLLEVRDQRTEAGVIRLPLSLKLLFLTLSILLVLSFLILGFVHVEFYLLSLIFGSSFVIFIYEVIKDLDNPFGGVFQLEYTPLQDAREYIEKTEHADRQS